MNSNLRSSYFDSPLRPMARRVFNVVSLLVLIGAIAFLLFGGRI